MPKRRIIKRKQVEEMNERRRDKTTGKTKRGVRKIKKNQKM